MVRGAAILIPRVKVKLHPRGQVVTIPEIQCHKILFPNPLFELGRNFTIYVDVVCIRLDPPTVCQEELFFWDPHLSVMRISVFDS